MEILLRDDELMTVREAMRGLNRYINALRSGRREKLVLTRQNRMVAVVISAERYAAMTKAAEHDS